MGQGKAWWEGVKLGLGLLTLKLKGLKKPNHNRPYTNNVLENSDLLV